MKKKKVISTIWLDFVNYIFMPFYILTLSLNLIECFHFNNILNIIKSIGYLICIVISFFTFIKLMKRKKISFYFLFIFYIISMLTMGIDIINRMNIKDIINILVVYVVLIIFWIVPNYVYLLKRKTFFKEHQLFNIKKCPGCNRIIPVTMKHCGRCDYKEEKDANI